MSRQAPRSGPASAPPPRRRLEAFGAGRGRVAITTGSPADTLALGRAIGEVLPPGAVLSLEGGLGAGKTLIAKGIGAGLGVADEITSPSFVLVEEYRGALPLLHVDLYRLDRLEEVAGIGLFDAIDGRSIVVIEWGDRLPPGALRIDVRIAMRVAGPEERAIEIEGPTELLALLPRGKKADGGIAGARSGGGRE